MCSAEKQIPSPNKKESPYGNGTGPEIDTTHYRQSATNTIPSEMPGSDNSQKPAV